jgi:glycosyltransferase involved in cell wall biosynthesis
MPKVAKTPIFVISGKSPISAHGGGYSAFSYNLATVLKELGHPVYIVALGNKNKTEKTQAGQLLLFKATLPLLDINIYALPGLPLYSYIFAKGIKRVVDEKRYGKFIVWGIGPWGFAGTLVKKFFNKNAILINHYFTTVRHEWLGGIKALQISDYGLWPKVKYMAIYLTIVQYLAFIEKIILKFADIIIVSYHSSERILKREFNTNSNSFYKIRSYVQVYKRKAKKVVGLRKTSFPKKYVLFFSRQDPRKGVNFLLHAMKILIGRGHKIPLLIAGGGDMLPNNIKLAKKLGIEKYVKFLGFVNDPKPLMENCTVFAFPSLEEGAGALTINEAMEMGIPVVSTACDGIVEDIENERSGLLVPMGNSKALANAIERIITDTNLAKRLGKNAEIAYNQKFNREYMKHDIKHLLLNI